MDNKLLIYCPVLASRSGLLFGNFIKLNSVAWARERTVPTERPQLVGEVSAKFSG
jgi:hypothetical protein